MNHSETAKKTTVLSLVAMGAVALALSACDRGSQQSGTADRGDTSMSDTQQSDTSGSTGDSMGQQPGTTYSPGMNSDTNSMGGSAGMSGSDTDSGSGSTQ